MNKSINKKIKNRYISVGIAAFNEANNIANVLKEILSQSEEGWKMKEVLVYNDGSTDNTSQKAKQIKNILVKIIDDKKRRGKTFRLSQMFKAFTGEILVMFDGDIKLADNHVITNILKPFHDPQVMLVGGNSKPFPSKNFFQRAVSTTFSVYDKSRKYSNNGNNIFGCSGIAWAIKKPLAKKIDLPNIINEDAFIYLYCINKKYKFIYQDTAVVFYTLPNNVLDYLRQAFRSHPEAVTIELKKYFGSLVDKEFKRPLRFYFTSILVTFLEKPLEVTFMVLINILCKPFYQVISKRYKLSWFTATSTH